MTPNRLLSAALYYARRMGWPVFPLKPRGKEPLTPHGFKDATTDEAQIRAWWAKWPEANIGAPTGVKFSVLDVDPRNGGAESLEVLTRKHGRLPDTLQQMTGGDGRHYLFSENGVGASAVPTGKIAPGLDFKGLGGYIVLAPSIHPSGKAYVWDGAAPLSQQPILALPGWLIANDKAKAPRPEPEEPIFAGERNARLFNQACKMRWAGFSKETIRVALSAQNKHWCNPPLEEIEIDKIAESSGRYPPGTTMPPPEGDSTPPNPDPESKPSRPKSKRATLLQAETAIERHPDWAGVLTYNQFSLEIIVQRGPPFPFPRATPCAWTDIDDINTAIWLQSKRIIASSAVASQAIQAVAHQHSFHPVRDYLDSLAWDGISRIDDWLTLYLGCDPSDYLRAIGAKWLVGAVARIFQPGSKNDSCLILEGAQGTFKSSALKVLAGDWFTDDISQLGSKDAAMQCIGMWIIEISELDALRNAEVSSVKAFISRDSDRFRPPYGRYTVNIPRQCVFAGTSNHTDYLKDDTGGRRFWPVRCGKILLDVLARDRDQLWAEAVHRYRGGAPWWLESDELVGVATVEQDARFDEDPWQPTVSAYISGKEYVTVSDLLKYALEKPEKDWTQRDKNRVARCLQRLRWERFRARLETGRLEWRYRPLPLAAAVAR